MRFRRENCLELKTVWSYVKLKYIVVIIVTGNVKPFKKHGIVLQEINDVLL